MLEEEGVVRIVVLLSEPEVLEVVAMAEIHLVGREVLEQMVWAVVVVDQQQHLMLVELVGQA